MAGRKHQRAGNAKNRQPDAAAKPGIISRESPLLAEIRLAVGSRRDVLACRINVGAFMPIDWLPGKPKRIIRSAPTGFPDLPLWQLQRQKVKETINPDGFSPLERETWVYYCRGVMIETKSLRGEQRKEQRDFQSAFESIGGIYILARSVEDVLAELGPEPDLTDWNPDLLPANR